MIQILRSLLRVASSRSPVSILALDSAGNLRAAGQREVFHLAGGWQIADAFVHLGPVFVREDGVHAVCCVGRDVEARDAGHAGEDGDEGRDAHGDVLKKRVK